MAVDVRTIEKYLSHAELLARFRYDMKTGIWSNRKTGRKIGKPRKPDGYVKIYIDKWRPFSHRLAWFYVNGKWPRQEIDHRDCNPANNAWSNLRSATSRQNKRNMRISARNKSGAKGVHFCKFTGRYRASITVNHKSISLGRRDTVEEAHALYVDAARKIFGDFVRIETDAS